MTVYSFKLILILVFNISVNIYYINSECKCCCGESNKNNSGGGIKCDKFEIDLINNTLKRNENVLTTGFEKITDLASINPQRVINTRYNFAENIYYTIDVDIFNSIKKDNAVTITKNLVLNDRYIVFAVKTLVKGFDVENPEYDYYIVYCHSGNSVKTVYNVFDGLFEGIVTNDEIKILCSGNNLINIDYMFHNCKNLTKIIFTIKGLNTSNVTTMDGMFRNCEKLEVLDLSTFDTNKVTSIFSMFFGCTNLTSLNVSNFNTSNVTNMKGMFYECKSLTSLDVSNFSTQNVTDMGEMFAGCTNLTSLILPDKVIHENLNMANMFNGCDKLSKKNVSTKDGKVKDMFLT